MKYYDFTLSPFLIIFQLAKNVMVNLLLLKASLLLFTQLNFLLQDEYAEKKENFADNWEYIGIAVEDPEYTVWGTRLPVRTLRLSFFREGKHCKLCIEN